MRFFTVLWVLLALAWNWSVWQPMTATGFPQVLVPGLLRGLGVLIVLLAVWLVLNWRRLCRSSLP